jgi:ribosomal peptide maturation radical SAM protein 1
VPEPVRDLDSLPTPDFGDYLAAWEGSGLDLPPPPMVVLETSRGCWWGERTRCSFCGLFDFRYRTKSTDRALAEVREVLEQFPVRFVSYADNVIPAHLLEEFVPALARADLGAELFYEVRPNVSKEDLRRLRDGRVTRVRAGIESLSTPILRLMRKGTRALDGIRILKWCRELGLELSWNFLWGFPGEDPEEYARMAAFLPLLTHLRPPTAAGPIQLQRYSLDFERTRERGFANVRPAPAYRHIYGFDEASLSRLAVYFEYEHANGRDPESYVGPLRAAIANWRTVADETALLLVDEGERLVVGDLRPVAVDPLTVIDGPERDLLLACDGIATVEELANVAGVDVAEVETLLPPLLDRGFLIRDGRQVLSLPVPVGEAAPPPRALERLLERAAELGVSREGILEVPLGG